METGKIGAYSDITFEDIIKSIKKSTEKFDLDKIYNDKKLILILNIYSESKKNSKEGRFINLINILEILKEKEEKNSINVKIKKEILNVVNKEEKITMNNIIDDEEKKQYEKTYNRYKSKIGELSTRKTLNNCLNKLKNDQDINIKEYNYKIHNAFKIRNKMVHGNDYNIDEEFYESLDFLKTFITEILKCELEKYKF